MINAYIKSERHLGALVLCNSNTHKVQLVIAGSVSVLLRKVTFVYSSPTKWRELHSDEYPRESVYPEPVITGTYLGETANFLGPRINPELSPNILQLLKETTPQMLAEWQHVNQLTLSTYGQRFILVPEHSLHRAAQLSVAEINAFTIIGADKAAVSSTGLLVKGAVYAH